MPYAFDTAAPVVADDGNPYTSRSAAAINTPAGALIIVCVWLEDPVSYREATVTDTAGNTYTNALLGAFNSGTAKRIQVLYAANTTANAANVVTAASTVNARMGLHVLQYTSLATTSPLDVVAEAMSPTAVASLVSSAYTTTQAEEMLFGFADGFGAVPSTPAGFTSRTLSGGQRTFDMRLTAIATAATLTVPLSASAPGELIVVSFKEPGAGPVLSGAATLDDIAASGGLASAAPSTLSGAATLDDVAASGGITSAPVVGTFTSESLRWNNDTVEASVALTWLSFRNITTGTVVLNKTGVSTNSLGVFSVADALLVPGIAVRADWKTATGHHGWGIATPV